MALFTPSFPALKSLGIGVAIIAMAAVVALLYYGRAFFVTLFISAVFAFILDPAVLVVMKLKIPRPAASAIVILVTFLGIYALGVLAWGQLSTLAEDIPTFTSRVNELFDKASHRLDSFEKNSIDTLIPKSLRVQEEEIQQKPQEAMKARRRRAGLPPTPPSPPPVQDVRIRTEPKPVLTVLYGYFSAYFHALLMASFVPFLVYFMLSWRDHLGKSVLRIFPGEERHAVGRSLEGIADSTRAYVLGNFFLWLFLSSVSGMVFFFFGVPYWLVIGPLSGFFSLVPYVGLPLAILPPVFAMLAGPTKLKVLLTVILVTAALHLIALNFLYAKIVGRRVRINPLVVTVALMFWGAIWGGLGLILAIPITAAIKAVCDNVESLQPYGRLLGD
ncbi:MAG TPA: AI-2E family transporter [Bryobacteraceae bacterium]|nr:AI-2E family transporter [Bryobacteraceae bacterium]